MTRYFAKFGITVGFVIIALTLKAIQKHMFDSYFTGWEAAKLFALLLLGLAIGASSYVAGRYYSVKQTQSNEYEIAARTLANSARTTSGTEQAKGKEN